MNFSLIIPCFNEARNLPAFFAAATACLDAADLDYELVFVDDGSSDGTTGAIEREIAAYRALKAGRADFAVVEFSRNFGKEAALFAGLERARGDCVGFIDADMQQEPQVALRMYRYLKEHAETDCVAAVPERRRESLPLRACKRLFYHVFNGMSDTRIIADVSDFRVFRRPVAQALLSMREQFRFSKGLFAWIGFSTHVVPYQVQERLSGKSKWTVLKLVSYAWNGVLAFSTWPLKLIMYAGIVLALVSLGFFGWDLFDKLAYNDDISMTQILIYVVLLMGGVQMFVLGIFGEYMARAYIESKRRPVYLARKISLSKASEQREASPGGQPLVRKESRSKASEQGCGEGEDAREVAPAAPGEAAAGKTRPAAPGEAPPGAVVAAVKAAPFPERAAAAAEDALGRSPV